MTQLPNAINQRFPRTVTPTPIPPVTHVVPSPVGAPTPSLQPVHQAHVPPSAPQYHTPPANRYPRRTSSTAPSHANHPN